MSDAVASILVVIFLAIAVLRTYSFVLELRRFGFSWEKTAALFWPLFWLTFGLSLARRLVLRQIESHRSSPG